MAEDQQKPISSDTNESGGTEKNAPPRKIPGNLPYIAASGTLKKALDRLIEASRPDKFNADYLENVLKLSGGAARATIPILKKMGFLSSDGSPTELYAKFRTDGGRPAAALAGFRNGFPEIFKRSEYAHSVDDHKLRDIIVEITGLKSNDPVSQAIKSTFGVVRSYIPLGFDGNGLDETQVNNDDAGAFTMGSGGAVDSGRSDNFRPNAIGLAYNINIVIPETSDLKDLNAIFRSIKENLLR